MWDVVDRKAGGLADARHIHKTFHICKQETESIMNVKYNFYGSNIFGLRQKISFQNVQFQNIYTKKVLKRQNK